MSESQIIYLQLRQDDGTVTLVAVRINIKNNCKASGLTLADVRHIAYFSLYLECQNGNLCIKLSCNFHESIFSFSFKD